MFQPPPATAAWQHRDARVGFESAFLAVTTAGIQIDGWVTAVEDGRVFAVGYEITLDPSWHTRRARVTSRAPDGKHVVELVTDGTGIWTVDGTRFDSLDGCLDVDLAASALTNAFPVHRLGCEIGESAEAPAAYVDVDTLTVTRLEQRYRRIEDDGARQRFAYAAPEFDFTSTLT
ncbi:putative glycolipid-binding domain-containing protein [Nocardia altamirensis]|uniref:putative glycolipid-binding domain-containing protein n=1 Tax=Nocardia altamirensis TaxID=472158 RepID=UPI0008400224|nr:putative glycolipid-binding domain-containing protein [Nocardia altamirensis]